MFNTWITAKQLSEEAELCITALVEFSLLGVITLILANILEDDTADKLSAENETLLPRRL